VRRDLHLGVRGGCIYANINDVLSYKVKICKIFVKIVFKHLHYPLGFTLEWV